jgi:hypothetical protein
MATLNTNLTGPELYHGIDPNRRNLWGYGWKRGYNDPWRDEKTRTFLGNLAANFLLPGSGVALGTAQKVEGLLDPYGWNEPFHKSEETMEKEKQADIASRDDYPAVAKERKRLWKLYLRLGRPADLATYKRHRRVFG